MSVLVAARSGIARAGATRSGYPIAQGVILPKYALANVARAGATRSNYHSPKVFVSVDGTQRAFGRTSDTYKISDLVISDILNATPNRATFTAVGFTPAIGDDVVVTLGSTHNDRRQFAGQILGVEQGYVETPANQVFHVNTIDYTWGLNKRKVTKRYTGSTVAVIAADLVSTYASGYTLSVESDIGAVSIDEITFTSQDLTDALSQLAKRAAGDWRCDYHQVVRLFFEDTSETAPSIVNAVHPTLQDMRITRDLSQWITRVYVEGGGANAMAEIAAGETIIPVEDASWYQTAGGTVISGPQHITYTSAEDGGGGGLVGPGASPSAVSVLALASGAGIESGAHLYAVTFVTGAGESLPSPSASITVGVVAAPSSAPTAGTPTIGTGPNPGSHDYAVTFVTSSGETTASPTVTKATTLTTAPSSAPTPGTPTSGGSVNVGTHDYAVTFVTTIGETTPSPISGTVAVSIPLTNPSVAPTETSTVGGGNIEAGYHDYAYTFVVGSGETVPSPRTTSTLGGGSLKYTFTYPTGPSGTTARNVYRTVASPGSPSGLNLQFVAQIADNVTTSYQDNLSDAGLGAVAPSSNTTALPGTVPLTGIPTSGTTGMLGRNLYRRSGGAGLKLLAYIGDDSTTTYSDTTANASLGAAVPSSSTAYLQRIPLTAIPTGGSLVTSRKVYRTAAGGSQLKLLTTLADNTTTTFTDTVTDASLGANVPVANTATANQVAVSSIPIGAASVTSRKVYRTVGAGSQLKLLTTIADNTTTTYADSTADGSLGANVPITDASGLTQASGNVNAGSTTLIVAGTWAFSSVGGWAVIGNGQQVIRYTGVTGSSLSGIPASGTGAIVATIGYNSTVTAAPCLRGIPASGAGSVLYTIVKGDPVNLFVQVDDTVSQTALAAYIGGDGIQDDTIQDRRLSYTEALARGTAWVAFRGQADVAVSYAVRDLNTEAGRTVTVNIGAPTSISDDFLIQDVTVSDFDLKALKFPRRVVKASNTRFSFEDVLRQIRG